jgi:PhzF family phenazine biosynthesis protein
MNRRFFLLLAAGMYRGLRDMTNLQVNDRTPLEDGNVEVVHTSVFRAGANGGNACPIVPYADRLSDNEMQTLARRFGLDTVFILQPQSKTADLRLRYFFPDHEMGISGHATIAAVTVALFNRSTKKKRLWIETVSGLYEISWEEGADGIAVTLEQNQPWFGPTAAPQQVARVLAIPSDLFVAGSPIQCVSVSRAKLLVPLNDWKVLDAMNPDFEALWHLCDELEVTGLYVFTRHTNKEGADVEARQFPLRAGFPEDAAKGVAAAALGAYLATYDHKSRTGHYHFRIAQGYAMGAPSLIEAIVECENGKVTRTAIRGTAHIVRRERILDRQVSQP